MLVAVLCVLCLIVGGFIGYFARFMHDTVTTLQKQIAVDPKKQAEQKMLGNSGVITHGTAYQRGQVVDVPSYEPNGSTVIRAPKPSEVKREREKLFQKELQDFDPYKHTERIL